MTPSGTSPATTPRFRSKVDSWLFLLLGFDFVIVGVIALQGPRSGWTVALTTVGATTALLLWLIRSTRYEFTDDALVARMGPMRWRVRLAEIQAVKDAGGDMASAPAWSMDRLELTYGTAERLLVSPADRGGFLRALRARVPAVRIEGKLEKQMVEGRR